MIKIKPECDPAGFVASGFEAVQDAFVRGAGDLAPGGGAFSAYVEGEKVVDLWTGQAGPGRLWRPDTLTTLLSCTKGLTALCALVLFDQGVLDVDAPVAQYWPEFAAAGKAQASVRRVLNHTVGVLGLSDPAALLDWDGGGWDRYDEIAKRLAAEPASWEPGTRIGYHAISFGWLVGELVYRITGQSIGTFFREQVALPLGLDAWIGTPPAVQARLADLMAPTRVALAHGSVDLDRLGDIAANTPGTLMARAAIHMRGGNVFDRVTEFFNKPPVRAMEVAAANASATAADLARVYALLSMGGELDRVRLCAPQSIRLFATPSASGPSALWDGIVYPDGARAPAPWIAYALGYQSNHAPRGDQLLFGPTPGSFGHDGAGGQLAFCDPVHRVAIASVRNHLTQDNALSHSLVEATYACIGVPTAHGSTRSTPRRLSLPDRSFKSDPTAAGLVLP